MACQLVGMIFECGFDYPNMGNENGVLTSGDGDKLPDFIPENFFYRLAMKAKNKIAEKF